MVRRYVLEREQIIPRPRGEVFAFFARPENLQILTPDFLHFEFLTPSPIPMHTGALIEYRLRLWGLPVTWATRIVAFEPQQRFVDEQIRGPYRLWRHTHEFHDADGGTRMVDRVEYELPFGSLGALAHTLFVRRSVRRIFDFRRDKIAGLWPAAAATFSSPTSPSTGKLSSL
jgi:hypothetical protein